MLLTGSACCTVASSTLLPGGVSMEGGGLCFTALAHQHRCWLHKNVSMWVAGMACLRFKCAAIAQCSSVCVKLYHSILPSHHCNGHEHQVNMHARTRALADGRCSDLIVEAWVQTWGTFVCRRSCIAASCAQTAELSCRYRSDAAVQRSNSTDHLIVISDVMSAAHLGVGWLHCPQCAVWHKAECRIGVHDCMSRPTGHRFRLRIRYVLHPWADKYSHWSTA
jgi:hypothetical protein